MNISHQFIASLVIVVLLGLAGFLTSLTATPANILEEHEAGIDQRLSAQAGVAIPVRWGDLGTKLVASGVIDLEKFEALYAQRGGLSDEARALLREPDNGEMTLTAENANVMLNLLWALGLANKNEILREGPMADPQYGGIEGFASTGGWSLGRGAVTEHYGMHTLITLTPEQQLLVENMSKNIYRPCCNNPTHFPDCNHGMAMLGLLELMASQGMSEQEMYRVALEANALWFPDAYATIGQFLVSRGIAPESVSPAELLGKNFSSASGYRQITEQVTPQERKGGGSCGV